MLHKIFRIFNKCLFTYFLKRNELDKLIKIIIYQSRKPEKCRRASFKQQISQMSFCVALWSYRKMLASNKHSQTKFNRETVGSHLKKLTNKIFINKMIDYFYKGFNINFYFFNMVKDMQLRHITQNKVPKSSLSWMKILL